jgi:hypothetical protein
MNTGSAACDWTFIVSVLVKTTLVKVEKKTTDCFLFLSGFQKTGLLIQRYIFSQGSMEHITVQVK